MSSTIGIAGLAAQRDQVSAPFVRHGHTGWVPEVGHRVDELRSLAAHERLLELLDDHAVVVELDRQVARLIRAEGGECADVGWGLDGDQIAWVDEYLADQVKRLLRARRDDHILRIGGRLPSSAMSMASRSRKPSTPCPPPYCSATSPMSVEHLVRDRDHLVGGKRLHVRHTTGERDDLRTRGDREQRAHLRRGHPSRASRVAVDETIDRELGHGLEGGRRRVSLAAGHAMAPLGGAGMSRGGLGCSRAAVAPPGGRPTIK